MGYLQLTPDTPKSECPHPALVSTLLDPLSISLDESEESLGVDTWSWFEGGPCALWPHHCPTCMDCSSLGPRV